MELLVQTLKEQIFPSDAIRPEMESQYLVQNQRHYIYCTIVTPKQETLETLELSRQKSLLTNNKDISICQDLINTLNNLKSRRVFHYAFYDVRLTSATYGYMRFEDDNYERYTRKDLSERVSSHLKQYQDEVRRASSLKTFSPSVYHDLMEGNIVLTKEQWQWTMYIVRKDVVDFIRNVNDCHTEMMNIFRVVIKEKVEENKRELAHLPITYKEIKQIFEEQRGLTIVIPQDLES